jgi:outer membrane protein OmpA-like peptidoglycan-associated protein
LVIHQNEKIGYFVSRRVGGTGSDDIYKVTFEKGEFDLELLVQDKNSKAPMPNATVNFSDGKKLTTNSKGIITRDLDYDMNYQATSEIEKYMNESVSFSTVDQPYGTIKRVINVEKVKVGQKFTIENIFYDFDKWDILPESEVELDKLVKIMNDNPDWKVELGSHTDCRGSDSYNELLSQKRSDSAVGYIVSKGISKDRIIAKGYGESQLVNECDDGVDCSEADHRKNRRTEFKILGMGDE